MRVQPDRYEMAVRLALARALKDLRELTPPILHREADMLKD